MNLAGQATKMGDDGDVSNDDSSAESFDAIRHSNQKQTTTTPIIISGHPKIKMDLVLPRRARTHVRVCARV